LVAQGQEPAEHLQEGAGRSERQGGGDKGLFDKAKDKLTGR